MPEIFNGFVDRCELAIIGVVLLGWSEFLETANFFLKKISGFHEFKYCCSRMRPSQNLMCQLLNVFSHLQTGELVALANSALEFSNAVSASAVHSITRLSFLRDFFIKMCKGLG